MAFLLLFFLMIKGEEIIDDGAEALTGKSQARFRFFEIVCLASLAYD